MTKSCTPVTSIEITAFIEDYRRNELYTDFRKTKQEQEKGCIVLAAYVAAYSI